MVEKIIGKIFVDDLFPSDTKFECWRDIGFLGYKMAQLKNLLYKYQGKKVEITIREIK